MRVEIYWNLHKQCYSVRDTKTGRVVAHTHQAVVNNPEFVVRQSGNRKVRETGVKNVHAFVRGELYTMDYEGHLDLLDDMYLMDRITYNPYKYTTFVDRETEQPVRKAKLAALMTRPDGLPLITAMAQEG